MSNSPDNLDYQIAMHARSLCRWLPLKEAEARARRSVLAGDCWWWPEPIITPDRTQLRLFT